MALRSSKLGHCCACTGLLNVFEAALSNLWWVSDSVRYWSWRCNVSRRFQGYPTTCMWVSSRLPFTVTYGFSWFIRIHGKVSGLEKHLYVVGHCWNRLDEPFLRAGSRPLQTDFDVHHTLQSWGRLTMLWVHWLTEAFWVATEFFYVYYIHKKVP